DKDEIRQQISNYSRAVDRCDAELGKRVFHEKSTLIFPWGERDGWAFIDGCIESHLAWPSHSHQMSTLSIWLDGPDRARSEAYGDCTLRRVAEDGSIWDNRRLVRYCDQWVKDAGRWQITRRVVVDDMNQVTSSPEDTSGMATGRRDRTDASYFADTQN